MAWGQGPEAARAPSPSPSEGMDRAHARTWNVLGRAWQAPRPDSLMLSMSSESTTERLCSSPAMARSKAFCFTILLHSWYFILASLSWGFTFTTWAVRRAEGRKGRGYRCSGRSGGTIPLGQRRGWWGRAPRLPLVCPAQGSKNTEARPPGQLELPCTKGTTLDSCHLQTLVSISKKKGITQLPTQGCP